MLNRVSRVLPMHQGGTPLAFRHFMPLKRRTLTSSSEVFGRLAQSLLDHCEASRIGDVYVPTLRERCDEKGFLKILDSLAAKHLAFPVSILVDDLMAFSLDEDEFNRLTQGLREILSFHPIEVPLSVIVAASVDFLSAESQRASKLRDVLEHVILKPWSKAEVEELLRGINDPRVRNMDVPITAESVMYYTAGHPFLTKELLKKAIFSPQQSANLVEALAYAAADSELQAHSRVLLETGFRQLDDEAQELFLDLCESTNGILLRSGRTAADQLAATGFINYSKTGAACWANRLLTERVKRRGGPPEMRRPHPRMRTLEGGTGVTGVIAAYFREQLFDSSSQTRAMMSCEELFSTVEGLLQDTGFAFRPVGKSKEPGNARVFLLAEHDVRVIALCVGSREDLELVRKLVREDMPASRTVTSLFVAANFARGITVGDIKASSLRHGDILIVAEEGEKGGIKWFLERWTKSPSGSGSKLSHVS